MPQALMMILLVALFIYAIPLAILLVVIAGLIFRTKETIGLLAIGGLMVHPIIGGSVLAVLIAISLYFKNKEKKAAAINDPIELPPPTTE